MTAATPSRELKTANSRIDASRYEVCPPLIYPDPMRSGCSWKGRRKAEAHWTCINNGTPYGGRL
eukprot:3021061-Pyramimonas_sp.AAC.1